MNQIMKEHTLHLEASWNKTLSEKQKIQLQEVVQSLPNIINDITIVGLVGKYKKNGGFVATILLRNGFNETLKIVEASLEVSDTNNVIIARGQFRPQLHIKANAWQPWSFVFTEKMVINDEADLRTWSVQMKADGLPDACTFSNISSNTCFIQP